MSDDAATLMRNQKIILFDAQCKLCSAWCNFIIRACLSFEVKFAAACLVIRQDRAYVVWLFPINRR
ncbi:hypothetical protein ATS74_11950 [Pseudoalteromonas sp. H103]|jgi:predicted DCC family thiol-disulfide oxidoreductase YuxK|nr:hypothetical protein ATS74_11950 [Pseudoalteromonas sp. H103]